MNYHHRTNDQGPTPADSLTAAVQNLLREPMVVSRHITNLESRESLEAERDKAQAQVDAAPASLTARAELNAALTRLVNHDRTMDLIKSENPRIGIGEPQPTEYRTAEQIKADGIIGIYRT